MERILEQILLGILIILIAHLCYKVIALKKRRHLVELIPLIVIVFYLFFTTTGSARLTILFMGHPIDAVTTSFKVEREELGTSYLYPTKNIQVDSGRIGLIEVSSIGPIKFSKYYGFG